jgi:UDP-2-acetamido-3-amino-2,3-dideoxy-glucuronate N-acetyltransferase
MDEKKYFVHESSYVDDDCSIGKGTKVWHFSHVQSGAVIGAYCILGQNVNVANNAKIGNHVKIQNNVSIYEGVELEDYVFCGPSMVFTNIKLPRSEFPKINSEYYSKTLIKKSASIGANATIICGITIGEYALVGSGAVITKNVPAHALVIGNPGKIVGWVDQEGNRLEFNQKGFSTCGKYKLINNVLKKNKVGTDRT